MSAVPAAVVEVPHGRGKPRARVFDWPQIAAVSPVLAATMLRYLDQIALSLRPASVVAANGKLRQFAGFLTTEFPEIGDDSTMAEFLSYGDISLDANGPYFASTNAICTGDEDWFKMRLVEGDAITVDLTFTHDDGDLDLRLVGPDLENLTPCSVEDPSGCSSTDDEYIEYAIEDAGCTCFAACDFYVVVYGWDGAENLYDLSIYMSEEAVCE